MSEQAASLLSIKRLGIHFGGQRSAGDEGSTAAATATATATAAATTTTTPATPTATTATATASGQQFAVEDVSLEVRAGQFVALVGESGSGKSLTALSVPRLLPEGAQIMERSEINFEGASTLSMSQQELRQMRGSRIGMIFQEPLTSLNPLHTIGRQLREALLLHGEYSAATVEEKILAMMHRVAITDAKQKLAAWPHQLSGGQRQRVMIAMALLNNPSLLIADEPTTALDVTVQLQILDLIRELQSQMRMAVLLISHDLHLVRRYAEYVYVMRHGVVVEEGSVAEVLSAPRHEYTKHLINCLPSGVRTDSIAADAPEVVRAHSVAVHFPIRRGVLRRVVGQVRAVEEVSLTLRRGETLGIVGESGSGKTTLVQGLLRLVQPTGGSVKFHGLDLLSASTSQLRRLRHSLQVVFQDPFGSLSPRMNVGSIIAEGLGVHHRELSPAQVREKVIAIMAEMGLDAELYGRYPHEFSGGQRQRIAIARAMVLEPQLVVLDEPTSALDVSVQAQVIELLRAIQRRREVSYIFVSHDLRVVRALSHRVMVMREGVVVEQASCADIFRAPQHEYTKQLIAAAMIEQ